jgi:hypothetical protein
MEPLIIKPIPTLYDDTQYRSRLEARWAFFFDEIGVSYVYEPHALGSTSYVPDFFAHNLVFGKTAIIEIKPKTPNDDYIKYLKSVRKPGLSTFFILVGDPSFYQPNGIYIYGDNGNYEKKSFSFSKCERCGFYAINYYEYILCDCPPWSKPLSDWESAARKAKHFRFDL